MFVLMHLSTTQALRILLLRAMVNLNRYTRPWFTCGVQQGSPYQLLNLQVLGLLPELVEVSKREPAMHQTLLKL